MASKTIAPKWCKDAKLTTKGWTHPRTGELLIAMKVSQGEVNAWEADNNPDMKAVVKAKTKAISRTKTKKKAATKAVKKKATKAVKTATIDQTDEEILNDLEANYQADEPKAIE